MNQTDIVNILTVYECKDKIRVGKKKDGGYVIKDNEKYDFFLSGGVGGDISFEEDFIKRYSIDCTIFDGEDSTAEAICKKNNQITFIKKNITHENTAMTTNLREYMNNYNNIFVKLDIEGSEFNLFSILHLDDFMRIKQLVCEIHFPNTIDHWNVLKKITQTHYLIHYHANNNNHLMYSIDHKTIPAVFECTFLRKDCLLNPKLNSETLPTTLDHKNVENKLDYTFECPPWVHKNKY